MQRNLRSAQADEVDGIEARVVAVDIPGASAIAQVGTFLNAVKQGACSAPIPTLFPSFIQPGAVLDPVRLLVGNRSNFGAPPAIGVGAEGSVLSIDPTGSTVLKVPREFAQSGGQALALGGAVQIALRAGAVGTALLGPSPDGTCKAVFAVVTADGAIVQEDTLKGLDGIAPAGTVRPLLDEDEDFDDFDRHGTVPRLGVLLNGYTHSATVVRQLFISEPFHNSIAAINLVVAGTAPNQVFGPGSISRIQSAALNRPVDLAAVHRDADNINWASNTSLDDGSDIYVANRGNNTIVRISQTGAVVAVRRVTLHGDDRLGDAKLNGITTSVDGKTIYVTVTRPRPHHGGVLALPAF